MTTSSTIKAGARHNKNDQAKIDKWHKAADELKADMAELGATLEEMQPESAPANALKAVSETPDELRVANYIVLFGGRDLEGVASERRNADGTRGEFFTKNTIFESDATRAGQFPIDWEHNTVRNRVIDGIRPGEYLGHVDWKTARIDERGVWVERVLNRRHKYMQYIEMLIKQGLIGNSSEAKNIVKLETGEIKKYPLVRDTLTVQPMEPRMMTQNVVAALKALGLEADETASQATGAAGAAERSESGNTQPSQLTGVIDMTQEEVLALIEKRDADKLAAAAAEAERQKAEKERTDAAVKAALEAERAKIAAGRRLPFGGQAPHQARFADVSQYGSLDAGDIAFMGEMLRSSNKQLSPGAAKALAIRVAEGKEEIHETGRQSMKALGLEPSDALDATKANELNYTTQSGFGDEFVPTVWSSALWQNVRAATFVAAKLPQMEFSGPGDTFPIPLEGADPTFYRIGQATDTNATTGRPDATVGDSKVGTGNKNMTLGKMGARIIYTGEMTEDSIIPWVTQVRKQTEAAFAESLEHAVIDGDTVTAATSNINHIGGTPTSTGTKQDLFLIFDGFRKLPLITNTANRRSASGTLVDTDFLATAQLMGAAGLYADRTKTDFIVDANVFWKVQQILSVKTRDVFSSATLENGMFSGIWGFKVWTSHFMHWRSTTNPRKANTSGFVDLTTQSNNTTGALLAVRWDQWLLGYKRRLTMKMQDIPDSDAQQLIVTARVGLIYRDVEASAITYNVGV
jgi:HK97 family phage major capsid protein